MNYKKNYQNALDLMRDAAIDRLKKYGKTLDVHKVLKQMLMREKGYKSIRSIPDDVWSDFRAENVYGCCYVDNHDFYYPCDITKVRINKKTQRVEVYLYDSYECCVDDWHDFSDISWGCEHVWMTILDFIDDDEDDKPEYVWTFTAEQAADDDSFETITKVFATEKAAQKHLHDFVYGKEGELAYAEKRGWTIEHNEPDHFSSYEEGCYCSNHTEAVIEKQQVNH